METEARNRGDGPARSATNRVGSLATDGYATPPPAGVTAIAPWDHKAHAGSFIAIDQHTVAQHIGRGQYQVYDVERDLHGHFPDQTRAHAVDARGATRDPTAHARVPDHQHQR